MDELTLLLQIADAAFTTRDRQRTYFRTRDRNVLARSKDAEKHLDTLIHQYRSGDYATQNDLFDNPARPP